MAEPTAGFSLNVLTINTHKGFTAFNRRFILPELRDAVRSVSADIVCLQEVMGAHEVHPLHIENWPDTTHYEFLADTMWSDYAYGRNAVYPEGHHGNAVLSRFPIRHAVNQDVTHLRFERRGLLHCQIRLPGGTIAHSVCVHLSLFGRSRIRQMTALAEYLEQIAPDGTPLIIAGDFNDWRNRADRVLTERLGLTEVFGGAVGPPARSFPAALPVFRLDRIYVRGFSVERAEVHFGQPWSQISDHAALSALLTRSVG